MKRSILAILVVILGDGIEILRHALRLQIGDNLFDLDLGASELTCDRAPVRAGAPEGDRADRVFDVSFTHARGGLLDLAGLLLPAHEVTASRVRMRRAAAAWYHLGLVYRDAFGYYEAALEQFEIFVRLEASASPRVQKVLRTIIPALKEQISREAANRPVPPPTSRSVSPPARDKRSVTASGCPRRSRSWKRS